MAMYRAQTSNSFLSSENHRQSFSRIAFCPGDSSAQPGSWDCGSCPEDSEDPEDSELSGSGRATAACDAWSVAVRVVDGDECLYSTSASALLIGWSSCLPVILHPRLGPVTESASFRLMRSDTGLSRERLIMKKIPRMCRRAKGRVANFHSTLA